MPGRKGERGAALLTVLLLVAVISVMAATALEKLRMSTRLAGNATDIAQARAYAYAAETMATTKIDSLLAADSSKVSLAGGWYDRPFPLPVPGGLATVRVTDGANCFNLNSLVTSDGQKGYRANPLAVEQFSRLMRLLQVSGQIADSIAAASADWIDTDSDPIALGAEDTSYAGGAVPYRTANTLMADSSELRAVAGMTPDIYAALRPWVCARPKAEMSTINVNTLAPEQAPLLAMLSSDNAMSVGQAQAILMKRPMQGYDKIGDFTKDATSGSAGSGGISQVDVKTQWFALQIDVAVSGQDVHERALVDASRAPSRLVSRQWGERS